MASLTGLLRSERQKKAHKPSQNAILNREDDDQTIRSISFWGVLHFQTQKSQDTTRSPWQFPETRAVHPKSSTSAAVLQPNEPRRPVGSRRAPSGDGPPSWKQGSIFVGGAHDNTMHMYTIHDTSQIINWITFASGDA